MSFIEIVDRVSGLLQNRGRVTYRVLKREFNLDDEQIEDLKEELIDAKRVARDEDNKILVWLGAGGATPQAEQPITPEAERRQLSVMFCDLVGSTALSERLDPEELREVVRAYQQTSAEVIERFEGHIAQYLGDGLLVYFGYPAAHEDDAARAVRAGLEIIMTLHESSARFPQPIQVRIGIHTGPVVVGEMGGGSRHEQLALGETPNIAARVQGKAEPDEVVISAATYRLVEGLFESENRGQYELKGISAPVPLYRIVREGQARTRFEVAVQAGLTPFVGREEEVQVLRQCWAQARDGAGQVVLLSGEPGIGKSRLVQELKDQVATEGVTRIEFLCSPYHQNSALYPVTEHLSRVLRFEPADSEQEKLEKLENTLAQYRFPQAETGPLLATLLSLPHPDAASLAGVSPQRQKQKTQDALVAWLVEEAEQQPVYCTWEDLHWADPSSLEFLGLCLDQIPTARLLALLVFRPEFTPPWETRAALRSLPLTRLGRPLVESMIERVTDGRTLPGAVVQQVVEKTDGIPLFVEELTKMIVESGIVQAVNHHYELTQPLSAIVIPATLQDSLMARLDRLATGKEVAQLGATIGREFSEELLQAIALLPDKAIKTGLKQLVEAELVQQRGDGSQVSYVFKHALIQDTAHESLLKSKRREYHQQIAQVLEEKFPATTETQPELLAHHYTEAGLATQAIPYWQQAGQRASQRSANVEAVSHLTKGLELLKTLPDTPERAQQELTLQITLGPALGLIKGHGVPEVEQVYTRALELCRQLGETPQLFPVLRGLCGYYIVQERYKTAHELGEQLLRLAQSVQDPTFLLLAHSTLGVTLFHVGEFDSGRGHLEQANALYDPQQHNPHVTHTPNDPGVVCLFYTAWTLWILGYPDQALKRADEMLTLAQELSHPSSLVYALHGGAIVHQFRRERQTTQKQAEAVIALATELELAYFLAIATILQGWAMAEQGQGEEGVEHIHQGLAGLQATGTGHGQTYCLGLLAEAYGQIGQAKKGLSVLAEALAEVNKTGDRWCEADLYRLKGELVLGARGQGLGVGEHVEAEECFQKAVNIAHQQRVKSLELRAATSLARLWQKQGKAEEARDVLAPVYHWFTEGFDTKDLQEAKTLLTDLSSE